MLNDLKIVDYRKFSLIAANSSLSVSFKQSLYCYAGLAEIYLCL